MIAAAFDRCIVKKCARSVNKSKSHLIDMRNLTDSDASILIAE
jgi:hypothetical protein